MHMTQVEKLNEASLDPSIRKNIGGCNILRMVENMRLARF